MSTDPLKDIIDRMHAPVTLADASEPEDLGWVMLDGNRLLSAYVRKLGWRLIYMAMAADLAARSRSNSPSKAGDAEPPPNTTPEPSEAATGPTSAPQEQS